MEVSSYRQIEVRIIERMIGTVCIYSYAEFLAMQKLDYMIAEYIPVLKFH